MAGHVRNWHGLIHFYEFLGFLALVPSWPFAAFPMALMLEGYLLGTSKLIGQGNRRAYPWVIGLALFFGSLSVTLSVAGMYAGEIQFQNRLSLPVYQLEDAQKAEGNFAVAATQTQTAALGRIRNELSFFTLTSRAASTPAGTQSGFSRDRNERRSNSACTSDEVADARFQQRFRQCQSDRRHLGDLAP